MLAAKDSSLVLGVTMAAWPENQKAMFAELHL